MTTTTKTPSQEQANPIETQAIDKELKATSFGAWIAENKSLSISVIVLILVGVIGFGVFNHFQTKKNNEFAGVLFEFSQNELTQFREDKLDASTLVAKYNEVSSEMGSFDGAASFSIEVIDSLMDKGNNEQAYKLATKSLEKISNAQSEYFIGMRAAVLAENLGKDQEALGHLNSLISSSVKYMEDKIYLDLGRLQFKTGNSEKAKRSFQYVIDNGKEEEFKKMARLYLSEL